MATKNEIDYKVLGPLSTMYPQHWRQLSDSDAALSRSIYHRILADVEINILEAATMHWLSTARPFHPSPGELRDLALTLITRDELSADEAWLEVLKALKQVGSYGVPTWSSEHVARSVAALGNWKDFCMTELDQMSYARDSFMKIYTAQTKRQHDDRLMLPETHRRIETLIGRTVKRLSGDVT